MMAEFEYAIDYVLGHEGGLVDHPDDPGKITNRGISIRFLRSVDPGATIDDVIDMTLGRAKQLYLEHFWTPARLDEIRDQLVATKVLDLVVNMGVRGGIRRLQEACNALSASLAVDGRIGPMTINATNHCNPDELLEALCRSAEAYYERLIERRPELAVFRRGWTRRAWNRPVRSGIR
jgi:lysozyme family protein